MEFEKRSVKSTQEYVDEFRMYTDLFYIFSIKFLRSSQSSDSFSKQSSIYSSSSEYRQRSHLFSVDFVQSSASFIYPNTRVISSGYGPNKTHSIYIYSNRQSSTKKLPLVFIGSEYFLRKSIDFEQMKYPLSTSEILEPLVDLFLTRPQFRKEIPELNDLSNYRLLPQSISGLLFINSSTRHICSQFNENKFNVKDLSNMSQRENNIIQANALSDKRYQALKDELNEIYSYRIEKNISPLRIKTLPSIVTSISS